MPKKYKARKNPDGSLSIFDLEIMGALEVGEKGLKKRFGKAEMHQAVEMHGKFLAAGQNMFGYRGHNTKEKAAPVISVLTGPYVDDEREMLIAKEVRITDPDVIPRFMRGEMPKRSAEFFPDPPFVNGLAFLEGNMGHQNFSMQLPDLALEILQLSGDRNLITSLLDMPIELDLHEENHMPLDEETKAEIIALIREVLEAGKAETATVVEEAVALALKEKPVALAPDSQQMIDKALSKHKLELDKVREESDVLAKVGVLLNHEANVMTEIQLTTMFTDEKTLKEYGGRAGLFKFMKLQNEVGITKLSAELISDGTVNVDRELTAEFNKLWPDEKSAPVTLQKYLNDNRATYNMTHA